MANRVDVSPWEATSLTGAQLVAVGTTSVGTTGSAGTFTVPSGATHAYVSIEGAGIRFWNTGDTPTAGTAGQGHMLSSGAGPLEVDNVGLLRMVTAGTSSGTVQLSYHKYI